MSEEQILVKGKKPRVKKEVDPNAPKPAKKPRAKKAAPTKEEVLKELDTSLAALRVLVNELTDDKNKIPPSVFKNIPALVDETLKNLAEDIDEIEDHKKMVLESQQ